MSIHSVLKKEGIKIVAEIDALTINTIARKIADILSNSFPEQTLDRTDLFISISRLKMYRAEMPVGLSDAKYYYKNNSIYFNQDIDLSNITPVMIHECIHFLQQLKDSSGNLIRLGLSDYTSSQPTGTAINEAAVQLMACEANHNPVDNVKYYGISLNTISPSHYPLQCVLVSQLAYFTGTYPLYHSVLYSNDIFKNTLIAKSDKKTFDTICQNLDILIDMEDELSLMSHQLNLHDNISKVNRINTSIDNRKKFIRSLFFETQDLIIEKCFTKEFENIKDLEDVSNFQKLIYNFKNIIGYTDEYTYYNTFYCNMMHQLEQKKEYIENYGPIHLNETLKRELMEIKSTNRFLDFFRRFFTKLSKLLGVKDETSEY